MPTTQRTPFSFIKGDKVGSETDYRDALPVNMTAVARAILGVQGYMLQYPGLTLHAEGEGIDRGGVWDSRRNAHYRVSGDKLIQVLDSGSTIELGTVPGEDTAEFAYSFNNLAVLASGRLYMYNPTDGFRRITDTDLGNPIDICWIDGFFFMTDGESLFHTTIADETQIEAIDFDVSQFSPDGTLGVEKTVDNRVIVFNRYSTEYFVNDGSDAFAFIRQGNRSLKLGIVGTHAKTEVDGFFYGLGSRKSESVSVWIMANNAQKIATREIEKIIGEYTDIELRDVVLENYEEDGYSFLLVHLPNETLLYNITLGSQLGPLAGWTILKSDVAGDLEYRGKFGVKDENLGKWVFGDKQNSNIGILDNTVATQYDNIAEWLLFSEFLPLEGQSIDRMELQTIPGFTGSNDSSIAVSITTNGVYYGREKFTMYGDANEYNRRFIKRRLGYVREYIGFKFRGATRSRMAIATGFIDHG
ncbi:hypothetical protein PODOV084v1_p0051 [Vibrio phage 340E47.2]|nr:hypothetical protein PODOV084v1_p0051 [Vibrio phage 340E47.2]QZI91957.1 putative packaged DNA stabilization protein [Vibrio phage 5P1a]